MIDYLVSFVCSGALDGGKEKVCGFIGGTKPTWNYDLALESIKHRGPDDRSLHLKGVIRVGFRRLSIIDISDAANQPMFAEGNAGWVVFNGEIYGYQNLRKQLEKRGHTFHTESDTEVLLNAYLEWGDNFTDHIDGMFAIAIWDARKHLLKLYRDRVGIKPLYYFYDGKNFAFASELKALEIACESEALQVDETSLYDFLGYRYVPAPKTLYKKCFKLSPAHWMVFNPVTGTIQEPRKYWSVEIPEEPRQISIDECCDELRSLVSASVRDQMVADVPLGFFLSGGVDSSVVTASAAMTGNDISTFSIGFDSDSVSETPFAREVAKSFGTDHHERMLSQSHAQELLPQLKVWFDEPFADESALPTFLVSQLARENVTVVLTGDGGDEVFGGYRTLPRFARYDRLPSWPKFMDSVTFALGRSFGRHSPITRVLNILEMTFSQGPELWAKIMAGMTQAAKRSYKSELGIPHDYEDWWHYRQFWHADIPLRTRLQLLDFHTFLPGLVLTKVDRTTMAVSLEARVPLLDRRIIEFSFCLPEDIRFYGGELKGLLRHAFRGILSDRILDRRKKGFGIPRYYFKDLNSGKVIQEHILQSLFLSRDT